MITQQAQSSIFDAVESTGITISKILRAITKGSGMTDQQSYINLLALIAKINSQPFMRKIKVIKNGKLVPLKTLAEKLRRILPENPPDVCFVTNDADPKEVKIILNKYIDALNRQFGTKIPHLQKGDDEEVGTVCSLAYQLNSKAHGLLYSKVDDELDSVKKYMDKIHGFVDSIKSDTNSIITKLREYKTSGAKFDPQSSFESVATAIQKLILETQADVKQKAKTFSELIAIKGPEKMGLMTLLSDEDFAKWAVSSSTDKTNILSFEGLDKFNIDTNANMISGGAKDLMMNDLDKYVTRAKTLNDAIYKLLESLLDKNNYEDDLTVVKGKEQIVAKHIKLLKDIKQLSKIYILVAYIKLAYDNTAPNFTDIITFRKKIVESGFSSLFALCSLSDTQISSIYKIPDVGNEGTYFMPNTKSDSMRQSLGKVGIHDVVNDEKAKVKAIITEITTKLTTGNDLKLAGASVAITATTKANGLKLGRFKTFDVQP